ncbi:hypothetical protein L5515_003488 [Caenorhabditis briggsae]|uniref:Uncharacterized protein n=1 Tax=Caenorhabditis briggsae TaxID=6238 RepID=A0AAE9EIU1_CAEBR|nr:hypothetical protein L5515_003488 [Caenorhabditis briggsae]
MSSCSSSDTQSYAYIHANNEPKKTQAKPSSSSSSDAYNANFSEQQHGQLTYTACDVVTRHLITVLLSISQWCRGLAEKLGSEDSERCVRFSSHFYDLNISAAMSSVASKQALLIALGGISIAALFVWYIKKDGGKKKKPTLTDSNGSASVQNGSVGNKKQQQNGHANGSISSSKPKVAEVPNPAEEAPAQNEKPIEVVVEKKQNEPENKSESVETDHAAAGDYSEAVQQAEDVEVQEEEQKESEPEQKPEEKVEPVKEEVEEEQFVKKEEPKLKSAPPAAPLIMPLPKTKIPEEPTPTKCFGNLTVDTVSPASAFSWSEEMEKSYNEEEFRAQESSDIDRSPASPLRHTSHHQNHHHKKNGGSMQKNMSNNKKGARGTPNHNQHYQPPQPEKRGDVKKGQRRLTKEKSAEEKVEKPQKRVVIKETPVVQTMPAETTELPQSPIHSDESYEKSGSPGLDSQNSEVRAYLFLGTRQDGAGKFPKFVMAICPLSAASTTRDFYLSLSTRHSKCLHYAIAAACL